jgi:hypothetical protein
MTDVFISYKREDHTRVDRLASLLADVGVNVWYDAALPAGEEWQRRIEEVARSARAIVVCWTPHAVNSKPIAREIEIARERGVLLPVRFLPCEMPPELKSSLQYADMSDWSEGSAHKGLHQLALGLDQLLKSAIAAKLRERAGGENPEVVARLRALLVKIAREHGEPISYERAFHSIADAWADGAKTSFDALYGALDAIADQNRARREPPLFALVVNRDGIPGRGYFQKHCFLTGADNAAARNVHAMHLKRVYGYSWPNDP